MQLLENLLWWITALNSLVCRCLDIREKEDGEYFLPYFLNSLGSMNWLGRSFWKFKHSVKLGHKYKSAYIKAIWNVIPQ